MGLFLAVVLIAAALIALVVIVALMQFKKLSILLKFMIVLGGLTLIAISEDIPDPPEFVPDGGQGPLLLNPDVMGAANDLLRDLVGEDAAVARTHEIFLGGNYSGGNWSLNNSTVIL